jgi:hypothetical protein
MAGSQEREEQNSADEDAGPVPLARELMQVSKREVTTGTVQVRTVVDVEQDVAEATPQRGVRGGYASPHEQRR